MSKIAPMMGIEKKSKTLRLEISKAFDIARTFRVKTQIQRSRLSQLLRPSW